MFSKLSMFYFLPADRTTRDLWLCGWLTELLRCLRRILETQNKTTGKSIINIFLCHAWYFFGGIADKCRTLYKFINSSKCYDSPRMQLCFPDPSIITTCRYRKWCCLTRLRWSVWLPAVSSRWITTSTRTLSDSCWRQDRCRRKRNPS